MGIFRRGGAKDARGDSSTREGLIDDLANGAPDEADALGGDESAEGDGPVASTFARDKGPFDRSEVDSVSEHLDLGSLLVLGVEGMQLRLELDAEQTHVSGVTAVLGESTLQLQAFAAPRSGGLWAEIADEIASSVVARGGTSEVVEGPYGTELRTRVPSADAVGRTVFAPARFLGVDGPRWFLRGVLGGRAAVEEAAAAPLLDFFGRTVVVRDGEPMPPRELLPLTLPREESTAVADEGDVTEDGAEDGKESKLGDLNPFERGPEITEVR